jgi:hypothetical protein
MMNFNHTQLLDGFDFLIRPVKIEAEILIYLYIDRVYFATCVNQVCQVCFRFVTDFY